ncbi:MAG: dienelactone hydrolase family protein [Chlamydiota bacterium]
MDIRKIEYYDGDVLLEATVVMEKGTQKRPIVFIFHSWEGKGPFAEQKAVELAKLGYIGCALDLYGKGLLGRSKEENSALMSPLMEDRGKLQKRILAYKNLLSSIPEADEHKMGAIGFCFGGLCALDLARSGADIKGVVSFHGLLGAPKDSSLPIISKILALHGNNDPMVSEEDLLAFKQEMEKKTSDWQLHIFGQTMHAFTNKEANDPGFGTMYQKDSDRRSFKLMEEFFKEALA